jgi:hypothetical protein
MRLDGNRRSVVDACELVHERLGEEIAARTRV